MVRVLRYSCSTVKTISRVVLGLLLKGCPRPKLRLTVQNAIPNTEGVLFGTLTIFNKNNLLLYNLVHNLTTNHLTLKLINCDLFIYIL